MHPAGCTGHEHDHNTPPDTPPDETIRLPPVADDEQLAHRGDFVEDPVERYSERTVFFEPWDEPDSESFWSPEPDPGEFASLLRAGCLRAKPAAPDVSITTSGGLGRYESG